MSDKKSNGKRTTTTQTNKQKQGGSRSAGSKRRVSEVDYDYEDGQERDGKKRIKWTGELQARFLNAVNKLGLFHGAVPSAILKEMGPNTGLTRENVASHLQLYRAHVVKDMLLSIDTPKPMAPMMSLHPSMMAAPAIESLAPPPFPYTPTGYTGAAQTQVSLPPVPPLPSNGVYSRSTSSSDSVDSLSPSLIMPPPPFVSQPHLLDVYNFPSSYSFAPQQYQYHQSPMMMRDQYSQQSSQNEVTRQIALKEKLSSN